MNAEQKQNAAAAFRREMHEATTDLKVELNQDMEDVQTRLPGEFWKWARTADARYRLERKRP